MECLGEDSVGASVPEETIFANVKRDLTRYDKPIILLHDSATMNHTTAVLPQIIDYIREQGYEFDTLENHPGYLFPQAGGKKSVNGRAGSQGFQYRENMLLCIFRQTMIQV